jgi:hypothetical protein
MRSRRQSNAKDKRNALVPVENIVQSILVLRGQRVLLDSELADLYGVATKRFNKQVKRNLARFPADFMFQLSTDEAAALRSQFATLKPGRGQHRKYRPYAFTEHGAIMAAGAQGFLARSNHRWDSQSHSRTHESAAAKEAADWVYRQLR